MIGRQRGRSGFRRRAPAVNDTLMTLQRTNVSGSASTGFVLQGIAFEDGDVPSGSIPKVRRAADGVDVRAAYFPFHTYASGAAHSGWLAFHDSSGVAGSATKQWQVNASSGSKAASSFNFTTWAAGAADDITFDVDTGTRIYSMKNFAAGTGRWTRVETVFDSDLLVIVRCAGIPAVGTEQHHKVEFFLYFILDTDGATPLAIKMTAVSGMDWVTADPLGTGQAKSGQIAYDAVVKHGTTTLDTQSIAVHSYNARWASVRTTADEFEADMHWIDLGSMPMPTLNRDLTLSERGKLIRSGVTPPYRFDAAFNLTYSPISYAPLGNYGHSTDIGGTGEHPSRGMLGRYEVLPWKWSDAAAWKRSRIGAHASHTFSTHWRDDRDVGGSPSAGLVPLAFQKFTGGQSSYTGLAAATTFSTNSSGGAALDANVVSTGKVFGGFDTAHDPGHGGWHAFMEARLDLCDSALSEGQAGWHSIQYNIFGLNPPLLQGESSGYGQMLHWSQERVWTTRTMAKMVLCTPESDRHWPYIVEQIAYTGQYISESLAFYAADKLDKGVLKQSSRAQRDSAHFSAFTGMGLAWLGKLTTNFNLTNSAGVVAGAEAACKVCYNIFKYGPGHCPSYRDTYALDGLYTNFFPKEEPYIPLSCSVAGNIITFNNNPVPVTNGDKLIVPLHTPDNPENPAPTGMAHETIYYLVNVSGNTGQVAATPGGSPLTIGDGGVYFSLNLQSAAAGTQTVWNQYGAVAEGTTWGDDSYAETKLAATMALYWMGSNIISAQDVADFEAFFSGWNPYPASNGTWGLRASVINTGQ